MPRNVGPAQNNDSHCQGGAHWQVTVHTEERTRMSMLFLPSDGADEPAPRTVRAADDSDPFSTDHAALFGLNQHLSAPTPPSLLRC